MKLKKHAVGLIVEVAKLKNIELIDFLFDFLSDLFEEDEDFDQVMNQAVTQLTLNNKLIADWFIAELTATGRAEVEYKECEYNEVYFDCQDIQHLLLEEGYMPGVDYKLVKEANKIYLNQKAYDSVIQYFDEEVISEVVVLNGCVFK